MSRPIIDIEIDLTGLDDARVDWEHTGKLVADVAGAAMVGAVSFIRDTKLSLPGPAVMEGGAPGPTPGSPDQPVLHRETSALFNSILPSRWPRKQREGNIGFTVQATIGAGVRYAIAHEEGIGVPPRPFMEPAMTRMEREVLWELESLGFRRG